MKIMRRQTTFWDIQDSEGSQRLHFTGKKEQRFVSAEFAQWEIFDAHPVLAHHREPWRSMYFAAPCENPAALIEVIKAKVRDLSQGWRGAAEYFNPHFETEKLLRTGSGLLMEAPSTVAEAIAEILRERGLRETLHASNAPPVLGLKAWVGGRNYVVARDFRWEPRETR